MKQIYVRNQLNKMLFAMLGDNSLVQQWWESKNKGLDNKTPNEVYWSGEEGRQKVADYILEFIDYQPS